MLELYDVPRHKKHYWKLKWSNVMKCVKHFINDEYKNSTNTDSHEEFMMFILNVPFFQLLSVNMNGGYHSQ